MSAPENLPLVKQVILRRFDYIKQRRISSRELRSFRVGLEVFLDDMFDDVVMEFMGTVMGENIGEIKYPADWWQAVKERFMPRRWRSRFPIRYTVYDVRVHYPDVSVPEWDHCVTVWKKASPCPG